MTATFAILERHRACYVGAARSRRRLAAALGLQSNSRNSSTVRPVWRINARRIPTESSLCCAIERLTRTPVYVMTRRLPMCPTALHPARWKALAASRALRSTIAGAVCTSISSI